MPAQTTTARRFFGRCVVKGCKHRVVTEGATRGPNATYTPCPDHPVTLEWRELKATYNPEKECDGRCMGAVGPACDCSCGGENHGISSI